MSAILGVRIMGNCAKCHRHSCNLSAHQPEGLCPACLEAGPSGLHRYHLPNRRPYPWLLRGLLRWLQRRCQHDALKADILEGSADPHGVRWCETCGAIWTTIDGTPCGSPRFPEPLWEPKP